MVKKVCEYWNENNETTLKDISSVFNLHKDTIRRYLKAGAKIGWCNYDSKIESEKQNKKVSIFKDDKCIGTFDSI